MPEKVSTIDPDDLRYITLAEYAAREGKSISTCKREIQAGDGPTITQLSARRIGIRLDHYREYAERRVRRARSDNAASEP